MTQFLLGNPKETLASDDLSGSPHIASRLVVVARHPDRCGRDSCGNAPMSALLPQSN